MDIKEMIADVYNKLGGDKDAMLEWLQDDSNLEMIQENLNVDNVDEKSIQSALEKTMEQYAIIGDVASGMRQIMEFVEDDPFISLIPRDKEDEEVDVRVLEALDGPHDVFVKDEDILFIAKRI